MNEYSSPKIQGLRVKDLRKKLKLSRRAFAQRQNLSASTLQAIEEGLYKNGLNFKNSEPLIKAFKNEGLVVDFRWLTDGIGDAPKTVYALKLESVRSPKNLNSEHILTLVERNKSIMEQNRKAVMAIKNHELTKLDLAIKLGANAHLLKEKELYIVTGTKQDTLLHVAARFSNRAIIAYIITKLGIHPNIRNRLMDAPVHEACFTNNSEALNALVEYGATLDACTREGNTPLIWTAYLGNIECMNILLTNHVKINNTDIYGNTAAHWAAYNDKVDSLKFLYKNGAAMFMLNHDKKTPLDWACQNGHRKSVEFLLGIS